MNTEWNARSARVPAHSPSPVMKRRSLKTGLPPGTLMHIGEFNQTPARITLIHYDTDRFTELPDASLADCRAAMEENAVVWINIDGVHDIRLIEEMGETMKLHPLVLEDVVNTDQRPKCEDYESHVFVIAKMLRNSNDQAGPDVEQVSLVLTSKCVVSFQEKSGDVFDSVRDRLRHARGRIRRLGADYLVYALLDSIVDNYFLVLEKEGDRIEKIEAQLTGYPAESTLREIHQIKRDFIFIRKSSWPLREAIAALERSDSPLLKDTTRLYLRDVYDHCVQIIDIVETYRDMISGMLEMYMSSIGNRMNQIMKVLTLISTIFIPLTFLVGIYGMNFKHMPELEWKYGYLLAILLMTALAGGMIQFFRRRKWL